jgi:hypothetical protein
MTQSKRHSPCACHQREGIAAHACTARATLQTTSRQGFRPEASQNHLNNYTCIQKLAAQRIPRTRCAHNRASPFARARQHRTAAAKRSGRHNPAQASYKQHSQHDTIAGGTHRERVISAKVWQVTLQCAARAANHKQARFQTRSIIKSLEQRHMHS